MNQTKHHKIALRLFREAVRAADPELAVISQVNLEGGILRAGGSRYALSKFQSIHIVGAGKASAKMARAMEKILGPKLTGGVVNVPDGAVLKLRKVELRQAGHPLPDERGEVGARAIAEIASNADKNDLIVAVISGGASALLPLPGPGISLDLKKQITRQLLASGATIHEMNAVRKHISGIKGGHLARLAYPATVLTLVLSDVIGDDLDVIGSGPTVADSKTCDDALRILLKYGIGAPPLTETPKPGDPEFAKVQNVIVGSNRLSVDAAALLARELGYHPLVLSTTIDGETREVARMHAAIAREVAEYNRPSRKPACILSGGETTVTLRGQGKGGRNQEFVLAAAIALDGAKDISVFSAGTDGIDGPTDAAGAFVDQQIWDRAHTLGLDARDFLNENNAYWFFEKAGGLLKTGPTGTNVMDIRILLVG